MNVTRMASLKGRTGTFTKARLNDHTSKTTRCIIILMTFFEKLENFEYNTSTLVKKKSDYHGFFVI